MKLSKSDFELIDKAKELVEPKKVSGGEIKEVGCCLETVSGKIFLGVNIDLWCGIGFCAEHSAIAEMVSHSEETQIKNIVAHNNKKIIYPCGRCREMMELINIKNRENTFVIISKNKKVKLKELLPGNWL